jgi:endonuclease YncB( thermonuclease family)
MRSFLLILVSLFIPACAFAAPQKSETLTFEKVIDGATIVASEKTVTLWGVKALDPNDPASFAADLYLKTMLAKGALSCEEVSVAGNRHVMHCYSDGADIASLMVQMGMATAADPYYQAEEGYAQAQHRGVWHRGQGKPL